MSECDHIGQACNKCDRIIFRLKKLRSLIVADRLSSRGAPQKVINGNRQQLEVCGVCHRNHLLTQVGFCTRT